jgi:hypothetical protein
VEGLVGALPTGATGLFNPWADVCAEDLPANGPDAKRARLERHLHCEAAFIPCGDGAGWQGMRHTGLAFTSERHVLQGMVPRLGGVAARLTTRDKPFTEPSATLVWHSLHQLGIADRVVMWNALPTHPFVAGAPRTNRTPTDTEMAHGRRPLQALLAAYPHAAVSISTCA